MALPQRRRCGPRALADLHRHAQRRLRPCTQAQGLGARLVQGATDIPNVGRFAVLADPQGATFAVFTPRAGHRAGRAGRRAASPGTSCRPPTSPRRCASTAQYSAGPRASAHDMGAMGVYQIFEHAGAGVGGMCNTQGPSTPPSWLSYVHVADSNRAVALAKGCRRTPAARADRGPGRHLDRAVLDPQGGAFAVQEAPRQRRRSPRPALHQPQPRRPSPHRPQQRRRQGRRSEARSARKAAQEEGAAKRQPRRKRQEGPQEGARRCEERRRSKQRTRRRRRKRKPARKRARPRRDARPAPPEVHLPGRRRPPGATAGTGPRASRARGAPCNEYQFSCALPGGGMIADAHFGACGLEWHGHASLRRLLRAAAGRPRPRMRHGRPAAAPRAPQRNRRSGAWQAEQQRAAGESGATLAGR